MDSTLHALIEPMARFLNEYGVTIQGDLARLSESQPASMSLSADDRRIEVMAVYLPHLSATDTLRLAGDMSDDVQILVLGPRVHESTAETLRSRGIWYVDGVGNAFIRDRGLVVDVRGRRGPTMAPKNGVSHVGAAQNPFTPKRAQVVLALLSRPDLVDAPFREIADSAGVSVGMAKGSLDTLESAGFVLRTALGRKLIRTEELFDLWAASYPGGLGRSTVLFVATGDAQSWSRPAGIDYAISGEQAVGGQIQNPQSLVLYVDNGDGSKQPPSDLIRANRWRRDPHGNIVVRTLFWRDLRIDGNAELAPDALIYADLLASRESRQIEVARNLRRRVARLL